MPAATRQRKVLFLIADTGAGHRSAANAIHRAMRLLTDDPSAASPTPERGGVERPTGSLRSIGPWQATIVDAFAECGRFPLRRSINLYGPAIKYSPRLYGQFFRVTNSTARFQAASRLARPFLYQGLRRLFLSSQPDVIVSVHPLLNHISLQVLHDLDARVPFLTVITDLFTVHCAWIAPDVTACVVPTVSARDAAIEAGVPSKRVHYLGMPIDPAFASPAPAGRAELREALGLDPNLPTVLLVGGGEGAIGLAEAARSIGASDLGVQMVVVTGRNKLLYTQLSRERDMFCVPTQVLGFVNNMPDLMRAADVIVTKAGPGTLTEAMACGLPIILTGAIPGQEEGNLDYVLDNDLGVLARSPDAVVDALREILTPGSFRLDQLRANVRAVSRPAASFDIARLILKDLPEPTRPSAWARIVRSDGTQRYRLRRYSRGTQGSPRRRRPMRMARNGRARALQRGPAVPVRAGRLWLRGLSQGTVRRTWRLTGLADLRGARTVLGRESQRGKVQLRRPGGGGGRHDARPPHSGRGGAPTRR